jgi:hypothetical protein
MIHESGSSTAEGSAVVDPAAPLYVYGIVEAGPQEGLPAGGVGRPPAPVGLVDEGGLTAVVSPLPQRELTARREDLEAHQSVLTALVERTTVVPMRFGVVMDDAETLRRQLLTGHGPALRELLAAVRGRVQMTLKAFYAGDALLREVTASRPDIARTAAEVRDREDAQARSAKIWVGEVIANEVSRRREADERRILDAVSAVVDDVRVEAPVSEQGAVNAQLLVARERREQLDAVVRGLTEQDAGRLAYRYVGPLAPYSFADLALEPREESSWG